ncbi:MAG TPA: hypothetical protein VM936_09590 [Pyrinomonadaceae bacterium]|nr:hypothetical protein [Pyrinomonadaceae bacterium]
MRASLYAALLALALSAASALAQGGEAAAPRNREGGARRVQDFGDVLVSDYLARLDSFAVDLLNAPGARGYVVAYIVPNNFPGWPLRRANWARGYLIRGRGIDESRVEAVNGGYRDKVGFEFWVVPPGAALPVAPFDFAAELSREKSSYLFDRYFTFTADDTGIESGYVGYLDEKGLYAPFADALRLDPGARGCVIAYAARRERRGADRRLASRVKLGILRNHPVGAGRVVALGGGRRDRRTVEFWVVPPGSPLPKPTPDVSRTRRGRR